MDRNESVEFLCENIGDAYTIGEEAYRNLSVKRGLRNEDGTGVLIGITKIGSVQGYYIDDGVRMPMPGHLYYRSVDLADIVNSHRKNDTFGYEEVAYLLLMGNLPTAEQQRVFNEILDEARPLPEGFCEDMILKVSGSNVMNVLPRCVLALYNYDPAPEDDSVKNLVRQSIELVARFPGIVATAYAAKRHHFDHKSLYIHNPKPGLSLSQNFLRMLRPNKEYTDEEAKLLDLMLILHAEHGGGNNSTFTCRSLSSTGTDTYSTIAGAVCSLKGPLHGGANGKVRQMMADIREHVSDIHDDDELAAYIDRILDGEVFDHTRRIYGLGHAVYTISDPRTVLIRKYAKELAEKWGRLEDFQLIDNVERLGIRQIVKRTKRELPMCANVDMYSGLVYDMLGIPEELYTPLFATARIAGWCAHRMEEVLTCKRIMRPAYRASVRRLPYIPVEERTGE
ncbi:MAG: citrate synthase [Oscillibacter sp.]|nr:citrate synthase [Oscillibacter sp.]